MGTATALAAPLQEALAEAVAPRFEGHRGGHRGSPRGPKGTAAAPALAGLSDRAWRDIGRDVMALHEGYTRRSADFAQAANPIHGRLPAYQLYYLPRNWWRVARVIDDLPWSDDDAGGVPAAWLSADGPRPVLELLDLGCGTGAFSLAWLARLAAGAEAPPDGLEVRLTLVDQGHTLLDLAVANVQAFARRVLPGAEVQCEVHADGVQAFLGAHARRDAYAVAGGAMMLNELGLLGPRRVSERAAGLTDALRSRVRPGGCLLFVEPGTRRGYMNLMAVRDHLAPWPILHPCPHDAHCPMWGGAVRHWCHATEPLPREFFFDALLRRKAGLRFDMRAVETAALAAQGHAAAGPAEPFRARPGARIVSAPMRPRVPRGAPAPEPAERVVLVCAADGRLHERPAPRGLPATRGTWWPDAAGRPA